MKTTEFLIPNRKDHTHRTNTDFCSNNISTDMCSKQNHKINIEKGKQQYFVQCLRQTDHHVGHILFLLMSFNNCSSEFGKAAGTSISLTTRYYVINDITTEKRTELRTSESQSMDSDSYQTDLNG